MIDKAKIRTEATRLNAEFLAAGAMQVETDILQPAEVLLDLYGEDIRARAFVSHDPLQGEMMLRPDFTVPVVQMHMSQGAEPARYTYMGEVFRAQNSGSHRSRETVQVGYEVFDRESRVEADAEVFCLINSALYDLPVHPACGDIGVLLAAVNGLTTSDARKAALVRHVWRPKRFRDLLKRFSGGVAVSASRQALLAEADPLATATPEIGLRLIAEIAARIETLREDAALVDLSANEVALLDDILAIRLTYPQALGRLRDIAVDMPWISDAVEQMDQRGEALSRRGIDVDRLEFEGNFGRSSMEYYDGFVFGFYADGRSDLPAVATGGRYDALTRVLGGAGNGDIPAVGGVVFPELTLMLKGEGQL